MLSSEDLSLSASRLISRTVFSLVSLDFCCCRNCTLVFSCAHRPQERWTAAVGERRRTERVSGRILNGFLVSSPCADSFSVSIFFRSCWCFTPFRSPVDVFACRQGGSCLLHIAVNLQGLADQAILGNN